MILVEIFDEEHEKDLQYNVNTFLKGMNENDIIDIKYEKLKENINKTILSKIKNTLYNFLNINVCFWCI